MCEGVRVSCFVGYLALTGYWASISVACNGFTYLFEVLKLYFRVGLLGKGPDVMTAAVIQNMDC